MRNQTEVTALHQTAMEFAQRAVLAEDPLQAGQLFRSAFENERKAAEALADSFDLEPTRSVLYRSAATLALDCADFAEAERLAHEGLAGKPPADIAQELRDVLDQAQPELRRSGRSRGRPR